MSTIKRWFLALIALLGLVVPIRVAAQGGPSSAQIENFWRLISTGGRTFTNIKVSGGTISGVTISGTLFSAANGTSGAPSFSFISAPTAGMWWQGSSLIFNGGTGANTATQSMSLTQSTGLIVRSDMAIGFNVDGNVSGSLSADTKAFRDAAGEWGFRNGASPQALNFYQGFTDAANFSRARLSLGKDNAGRVEFFSTALGTGTAQSMDIGTGPGNSNAMFLVQGGARRVGVTGTAFQDAAGTLFVLNHTTGVFTTYDGLTTAATGFPIIVAGGSPCRFTAQSAAVSTVCTYTPTADASFLIDANVLITSSTTFNFNVNVTYTDEGNTSRTLTLQFTQTASQNIVVSIANANGAIPYSGLPTHIRAKANTAITVLTTGTFTTVTYNVEATIRRITT